MEQCDANRSAECFCGVLQFRSHIVFFIKELSGLIVFRLVAEYAELFFARKLADGVEEAVFCFWNLMLLEVGKQSWR